MKYDNKLIVMNNKKIKYQLLVILNLVISIGLTLTGTLSIVSLIVFLYETFNISLMECFALDIVVPYVYSCGANSLIKCIDKKTKDIKMDVDNLEKEYEIVQVINDIRIRFNDLSRDKQIELLNYVRSNYLYMINGFENIDKLSDDEVLMCINSMDEVRLTDNNRGYSRKKTIGTERI